MMINSDENDTEEKNYDEDDVVVEPTSYDTIDPSGYGDSGFDNQKNSQEKASNER